MSTSVASIDAAIFGAFKKEELQKHQYIYYSKAKNAFRISASSVPKGYTRLTLQEIVDLTQEIFYELPTEKRRKALSESIEYMRSRKIEKVYSGCWGWIRLFFARLSNLFQGNGFNASVDFAKQLQQQLTNKLEGTGLQGMRSGESAAKFRTRIYQQTLRACRNGYQLNGVTHKINHEQMLKATHAYASATHLSPIAEGQQFQTQFRVLTDDTLNVLMQHRLQGRNPVGINMANRFKAGGGVDTGCTAQEEAICRRSDHIVGLTKQGDWYPLSEFGGIYCPNVTVFREDEAKGFAYMPNMQQVALVAVAAFDLRSGSSDRTDLGLSASGKLSEKILRGNQKFIKATMRKIRNMLRTMASNGHQDLVLGALGCGAFQNPPKLIAELFQRVFSEPEFKGRFAHVDFAILEQTVKDRENVIAFRAMCESLNKAS